MPVAHKSPSALLHIPGLTTDLVTALDRLFPERCPNKNDNEREIWMYAGTRDLVRRLLISHEYQQQVAPSRLPL